MRIFISTRTSLVAVVGLLVLVAGCGGGADDLPKASIPDETAATSNEPSDSIDEEPVPLAPNQQASTSPARSQEDPEVLIRTSVGDIRLRLDAEKAPRTVENFLYNYVERGFYAQTVFHYVEAGYLVAAGGYTPDLELKEPRTSILCEANNELNNHKGTIAMAHHPEHAHSATSQFFINLVDNPSLDYQPSEDGTVNGYCVFGKVIDGMDTVERIAGAKVHDKGEFVNTPVETLIIESVERVK